MRGSFTTSVQTESGRPRSRVPGVESVARVSGTVPNQSDFAPRSDLNQNTSPNRDHRRPTTVDRQPHPLRLPRGPGPVEPVLGRSFPSTESPGGPTATPIFPPSLSVSVGRPNMLDVGCVRLSVVAPQSYSSGGGWTTPDLRVLAHDLTLSPPSRVDFGTNTHSRTCAYTHGRVHAPLPYAGTP